MYELNNSGLRAIQLEGIGDTAVDRLHFNSRKREQDLISMNKYVGKQWMDMHQHSQHLIFYSDLSLALYFGCVIDIGPFLFCLLAPKVNSVINRSWDVIITAINSAAGAVLSS